MKCGPGGWSSDELPWYKEGAVELSERFRRVKKANWFALIGAQGDSEHHHFTIGDKTGPFTITEDSDLYLFANDLPIMYFNNDNSLKVTITRKS